MERDNRQSDLIKLIKSLKIGESKKIKNYDVKTAASDRSILSRIGTALKIGFSTSYDKDKSEFTITRIKFVELEKRKEFSISRPAPKTIKVVDPRLEELEIGKSFLIMNVAPLDAEVYRIRRQARNIGYTIECKQKGKDVEVTRKN